MKERKGNPDMAMDYAEVLETACLTASGKITKHSVFARLVYGSNLQNKMQRNDSRTNNPFLCSFL